MSPDEERLRAAAARVDIEFGCDTPDWMAEEILRLRRRGEEFDKATLQYCKDAYEKGLAAGKAISELQQKCDRLEACGAQAIAALRICMPNPALSPGQRAVAQEALDAMFAEQEGWWYPKGRPQNK